MWYLLHSGQGGGEVAWPVRIAGLQIDSRAGAVRWGGRGPLMNANEH